MINTKEIIIERTEIYRNNLKDLTVKEIDELKNKHNKPLKPTGRMSSIAWDIARKEIVKKELRQDKINELKILLPSLSDEDIQKIDISVEDDSPIVKEKELQEIK